MPVLNDFGDAGVARVERVLQDFAAKRGVDKEYVYAFFNYRHHLPQTLQEFQDFLNDPNTNPYHIQRRDPTTGALQYVHPGPTPGKTDQERAGFTVGGGHNITNAEDTQVQRFAPVDANGNIFTGSWDPEYNRTHFDAQGQPLAAAQAQTQRTAAAGNPGNPYPPGSALAATWDSANPPPGQEGTPTPQTGAPAAPGGPTTGAGATPGVGTGAPTSSGLGPLIDAAAEGNTRRLQAEIDDALRRYAIARNQEERNQAYLDLQRWKQELDKIQGQQKTVADMAAAILSSATTLGSRPADYVQANRITSGGRDILDQISGKGGPVAAFGAPTGQVQPGSIWDLLGRLGLQFPQTPATPAAVQPGAPNQPLPGLPRTDVPGAAGSTPAAGTSTDALPASLAQALAELDRAAGGSWTGNRADKATVAREWWNANPARRGTPVPTPAWG